MGTRVFGNLSGAGAVKFEFFVFDSDSDLVNSGSYILKTSSMDIVSLSNYCVRYKHQTALSGLLVSLCWFHPKLEKRVAGYLLIFASCFQADC